MSRKDTEESTSTRFPKCLSGQAPLWGCSPPAGNNGRFGVSCQRTLASNCAHKLGAEVVHTDRKPWSSKSAKSQLTGPARPTRGPSCRSTRRWGIPTLRMEDAFAATQRRWAKAQQSRHPWTGPARPTRGPSCRSTGRWSIPTLRMEDDIAAPKPHRSYLSTRLFAYRPGEPPSLPNGSSAIAIKRMPDDPAAKKTRGP